MSVYPSVEEAFGPGRIVRLDPYDALRDARSEARYEPGHGEPQQWEVDEAAQEPLFGCLVDESAGLRDG